MSTKEYRKTKDLKLWEQNPRSIRKEDFERLKKQIQELGQYKPLIITKDGEVIGGNMRLRAYRELGIEDVWVSVVDPKDDMEKLKIDPKYCDVIRKRYARFIGKEDEWEKVSPRI